MLTKREDQVLALKAVGLSDKEICHELGVSIETVKKTVCNIKERVSLYKCTELVAWWWCKRFEMNFDELKEQVKRTIIACFFLSIISVQAVFSNEDIIIYRAIRLKNTARTKNVLQSKIED